MVENVDREADERGVEDVQICLAAPRVKRCTAERIASTYIDDAIQVGNAYAVGQLELRRALRQMRVSLMIAQVTLDESPDNEALLDLALRQMRQARHGSEEAPEPTGQQPGTVAATCQEGAPCSR